MPGELGAVIVMHRPEGADHGQVVGARADVRPPVAHLQTTLPVFLMPGAESHQDLSAAVGRVAGQNILQLFGFQDLLIRSIFDALSGIFVESRLGIKALHVADAAAQKYPDDRLGPGREMRLAVRRALGSFTASLTVPKEHRTQSQSGEPHAGIGQERAARNAGAAV